MNLIEKKAREYLLKKTIADIDKRILAFKNCSIRQSYLNVLNTGIILNLNKASKIFYENLCEFLENELKKLRRKR